MEGEITHHDEEGYDDQRVGAGLGRWYLTKHPYGGGRVEDNRVTDGAHHQQGKADVHAQEYQYQENNDAYDAYDRGRHGIPFLPYCFANKWVMVIFECLQRDEPRPGGFVPGRGSSKIPATYFLYVCKIESASSR